MFEWFKKKSRQESFKNIIDLLYSLIEVSNRTYEDILRLGDSKPSDRRKIHRLQKSLLIQLIGPLPFDRVKADIIEPILSRPETSEGARLAIEHVCNEVAPRNLCWSKDDYAAYEELLPEFTSRRRPQSI